MPVTRDADYPAEAAELFQMFSHCAEGHSAEIVLDAAVNFVIAAIGYVAKGRGTTIEQAATNAEEIGENIVKGVLENWARKAQPNDVKVGHGS